MVNYPRYGETQIRNVVVMTTLLTRIKENNDNEQTITVRTRARSLSPLTPSPIAPGYRQGDREGWVRKSAITARETVPATVSHGLCVSRSEPVRQGRLAGPQPAGLAVRPVGRPEFPSHFPLRDVVLQEFLVVRWRTRVGCSWLRFFIFDDVVVERDGGGSVDFLVACRLALDRFQRGRSEAGRR